LLRRAPRSSTEITHALAEIKAQLARLDDLVQGYLNAVPRVCDGSHKSRLIPRNHMYNNVLEHYLCHAMRENTDETSAQTAQTVAAQSGMGNRLAPDSQWQTPC
jgi:hypothetical protein